MKNAANTEASATQEARLVGALQASGSILAITGAGISAESGLPTFRGEGGWWRKHRAEDLATMSAFKKDPRTVWEWYDYRRSLVRSAGPNAAHQMLANLEQQGKDVFIITQNVDDLHERAGSRNVVHVHGSIWSVVCLKEQRSHEDRRVPLPDLPPMCQCGSVLRPGVVWFDEELPHKALERIDRYFHRTRPGVALVIGTEATFDYIRAWALMARRSGALLAEVNATPTVLSPYADVALRGKAGEILSSFGAGL